MLACSEPLEVVVVVCWGLTGGSLAWLVRVVLVMKLFCHAMRACCDMCFCFCRTRCSGLALLQRWGEDWNTYTALKSADEEALEDLAGLVAVADVLEGLGGVLAADVEEDFFTAGVLVYEAWRARVG